MSHFQKVKNNIEDVPMKFSDRYLTLLNNSQLFEDCDDQNVDDNIDQYHVEDYNFDSELIAIEMYELYQKKRKEEKQKIDNSIQTKTIQNIQEPNVQENWNTVRSKFLSDELNNQKPTMLYNMISGQILQPQPLSNNNYSSSSSSSNSGNNNTATNAYPNKNCDNNNKNMFEIYKSNSLVNPKEFENDDSSPFDNVELQTIDDIKELNKVFGALNVNKEENEDNYNVNSLVPRNSPIATIDEQATAIAVNNVVTLSSTMPTINAYPATGTGYGAIYTTPSSCQNTFDNQTQQQNSYSNYKNNNQLDNHHHGWYGSPQYSSNYHTPTANFSHNNNVSISGNPISFNPYSYNAANIYNYNPQQQSVYVGSPMFTSLNSGCSEIRRSSSEKDDFYNPTNMTNGSRSKSVSDLSQIPSSNLGSNQTNSINNTLKDRCKTPDNYSNNVNNRQTTIPTAIQPTTNQNQRKLIQTDPYESLTTEQKTFVDNLCQMGFKRDRISRAVKHINIDNDKKIFEYLFALQKLEDQGYDCYEAEIALHFNNYDKTQAENFLKTLKQICDFGFDKEKSIKALFKTNNDREKAIELLLKLH